MAQKRYTLKLWFYKKSIPGTISNIPNMEIDIARKTEYKDWVDENDTSIAKAILVDKVTGKSEEVLKRDVCRVIY